MLVGCSAGAGSAGQPAERRAAEQVVVGNWTLEVEPAQHLFAPTFGTWRWVDGALEPVVRPFGRECYLDGVVVGAPNSRAALRSCSADRADLRGVVIVDGAAWNVSPEGIRPMRAPQGRCATDPAGSTIAPLRVPRDVPAVADDAARDLGAAHDGRTTRAFALEAHQPRFVEVLAVDDSGMDVARDNGTLVQDSVLMVHMAAALYDSAAFADRVLPLLVGVVEVGGSDPWGYPDAVGGELPSGPYLDNFNAWLAASTALPRFDQATLFTGWDLDGATIGLATVEGACDTGLAGALVTGVGEPDEVSQTLAHEIGHTLGMWHDGDQNSCPSQGYIMTPIYAAGGPYPTEFSRCSVQYADAFLGGDGAWCITTEAQPAYDGGRCGDGKIDVGERCDCGPRGCAGVDPCCDEATCQLRAGAACAVGEGCCDAATCTPFGADEGVVCRAAQTACDVPETCAGQARCPVDQWSPTGIECTDGAGWTGACLQGRCVTRGGICERLSDDYVFDDPPYDPICADAGCGAMECVSGGACVFTQDPTPDGTPCGDGRQCWRNVCVASSTLPGADGCSEPDLDSDADGVRDCDDRCPRDPATSELPCAEDVAEPPGETNGGTTGPGEPQPPGVPPAGDDLIIVETEDPAGCAMIGSGRSAAAPALIALLLIALRRRRGN